MTAREQALADAAEMVLDAFDRDDYELESERRAAHEAALEAIGKAFAMPREAPATAEAPSGAVTLWLAEPRNTLVHEIISGVVRLCDGAPCETQEHPLGAWLLPTAMHGRLAIVAIADLFATTRNVVPPLALDGDG